MNSLERIKEEFNDMLANPFPNIGCTVGLENYDNYYEWKLAFFPPKDSLYRGGFFNVKLLFPENYPFSAPQIIFLTPIYHFNANPKKSKDLPLGYASIKVTEFWKPGTTARELITQFYSIFYSHNPDSPFGLDKALEYKENRPLFELKAKYFTKNMLIH